MQSDINQNTDEYTMFFFIGRIKGKPRMAKEIDYQEISYTNMKYICVNLITGNYGEKEGISMKG